MKKLFLLLCVCFGLVVNISLPGASAAYPVDLTSPNGWIPPANNTIIVPNTGGSAGPLWGSYVMVDQHGSATPFFGGAPHSTGYGWVNDGVVVLWEGTTPPDPLPSTLDALLSSPNGYYVNDLLVFIGGISRVFIVSEPYISLLPFKTSNDPLQQNLWNGISALYSGNAKAIIADLPNIYTVYTPPNETWPGWDPSVQDWAYYAGTETYCNPFNKAVCETQPRYNPAYPTPSTWTQYTYYAANDRVQVPEPAALFLLGLGLAALPIRRKRKESHSP